MVKLIGFTIALNFGRGVLSVALPGQGGSTLRACPLSSSPHKPKNIFVQRLKVSKKFLKVTKKCLKVTKGVQKVPKSV